MALALHQFHDTQHVFPSNGGWDGKQTILDTSGVAFTPSTFDFTSNQEYFWGVGAPNRKPTDQAGSWAYSILPYLEQGAMYSKPDWTVAVPVLICPARRIAVANVAPVQDAFGKYISGGWTWGKTDYAVNILAFDNRPNCRNMNSFTDGLSNTILVGEKAVDLQVAQSGSWYWDEPFFLGGSKGTSRDGFALLRDRAGAGALNPYKENWGSSHPGGVFFLFGDGAVHLIPRTIDADTFTALMTPDGGEAVSPP
jgi:hypothetical protein